MLQYLHEDAAWLRTRKISEVVWGEQVEYPMCIMTLNFLTQMQKLLRSCVVVALVFMFRTPDSTRWWWTLVFWVALFQIWGGDSPNQHVLYLVRRCWADLLTSCWRVRSKRIQAWSPFGMGTCSRDWCRS
jgi:hypothetical protein